jgi:hypothetical protein
MKWRRMTGTFSNGVVELVAGNRVVGSVAWNGTRSKDGADSERYVSHCSLVVGDDRRFYSADEETGRRWVEGMATKAITFLKAALDEGFTQ